MPRVMGVDIGTSALKMGVYDSSKYQNSPVLVDQYTEHYPIRTYNNGLFSDVDPELWRQAFADGCNALGGLVSSVEAIGLSGTTPGLTAVDRDGSVLYPAILMLDQRSRKQASEIIDRIGLESLLSKTGNMPVAGGCSLASILWLKENEPAVFRETTCFCHSNSFMTFWLTGCAGIDPSSASLSGLYKTTQNDLTWDRDIASEMGVPLEKLPELLPSWESAGRVSEPIASMLGFSGRPAVVVGGNDAVLAAHSVGVEEAGEVLNVNGTAEISLVCLDRCIPSTRYNIRAHVVPDRWLTLYVMNAGGKAYQWFHDLVCSEMSMQSFFDEFVPRALNQWLNKESSVKYIPYLMGSRYSLEPLRAGFVGLTHETSREEMLAALVRGLCDYQREHLRDIALELPLNERTYVTGGAVNDAIISAKEQWTRHSEYVSVEQSSMAGAARLAFRYLAG